MTATKQTAANNLFLASSNLIWNDKINKKLRDLLNDKGVDACLAYYATLFNAEYAVGRVAAARRDICQYVTRCNAPR